jgi:hypothetical protein
MLITSTARPSMGIRKFSMDLILPLMSNISVSGRESILGKVAKYMHFHLCIVTYGTFIAFVSYAAGSIVHVS